MDAGAPVPYSISFLDYELLPGQRRLLRAGRELAIGTRAFDLLTMLAARPGEVLSNRVLMQGVWPHSVVVETNLRVQVAGLRKLLGAGARGAASPIVNVAGRGYCFTADTVLTPGAGWGRAGWPARRAA
ncbi:hypothetical protein B0920_02705 [Massilia sp. KIM]|uniref:winged helix-turn-helix domain-containing protein n=1 Tax=Massilia sp. KIM TaxID=1955422 RepID=UPI0009D3E689|nr:winged helix-turn-helix domain-containing protein [Massilia sp. KIM]OON62394.1 hypothetical protein B0920_02705 [Massilia sp. KIM]